MNGDAVSVKLLPGVAPVRYQRRTGTCAAQTSTHSAVPADAMLYALVVYGPDKLPVEVRLPFPSVTAADHHATSHGIDGHVLPMVFPVYPKSGT